MTQISEVYQQAQFALAAYATLTPSLTRDDYIEALSNEGMTTAQAQQFADQYKVVDQYNDSTGASATVFVDGSGNRYLAIRGTEKSEASDYLADSFILAGWPSNLNPQFLSLN